MGIVMKIRQLLCEMAYVAVRNTAVKTMIFAGMLLLAACSSPSAELTVGTAAQTMLVYDCAVDQSEIPVAECQALVDLYNDTDGDNWTDNANWGNATPSTWSGVGVAGGVVTQLIRNNNNLVGTIPTSIGNITSATTLQLRDNSLTGPIPSTVGNLVNVTLLSLFGNQLSGTLPVELGDMTALQEIRLNDNLLTGSIPTQLGNLSNLTQFSLGNNQLSGSIPTELGMLGNLLVLNVSNNMLTGSIPTELGNIGTLVGLRLNSNQLSGSIPMELGNIGSVLRFLTLDTNQLSGPVPSNFDEDLTGMAALTLNTNLCLTDGGDTALATWIAGFDANWQDGCLANGQDCSAGGNESCLSGICDMTETPDTCEPADTCGNSVIEGVEECDDGNTTAGDGCDASCVSESVCGDGTVEGAEVCDDGNTVASDGCDATCAAVETGYVCLQDTTPMDNICDTGGAGSVVPVCGDGIVIGGEVCDDGNTASNDGCDATCAAVETGYVCLQDTTPMDNICDTGGAGSVVPLCGDGMVIGGEVCDDGNTVANDGCDATCAAVETGYVCLQDTTPMDNICDTGGAGSVVPVCGDGIVIGTEVCDDGNTVASDGCDATCAAVETGYVCLQDTTPMDNICDTGGAGSVVPVCGDGIVIGTEVCDDGNTATGDGCDASCAVETGWSCDGADPTTCNTTCGDSIVVGTEVCDDGNTTANDGCDATCAAVETGYVCLQDTTPMDNICDTGGAGSVVPVCGDGIVIGGEVCDDGNTASNDGCDATCAAVETGYVCLQDTTPMDNICDTGGAGSVVPVCGDGMVLGGEVCDDGNTASNDGCDATCAAVETGYVCLQDTTPMDNICDTGGAGSVVPLCGDGMVIGGEVCDDGNTASNDGCDATCAAVETGYVCLQDTTPMDNICDTGGAGSVVPVCGDGMVLGGEVCDDGNTASNDGCDATCAAVETGYACLQDTTPMDNICDTGGAGSVVPVCGDGMVIGGEVCDDGNTVANDGCDATCAAVETGYVCLQDTTPMDNICDTGGAGSVVPVCGDGIVIGGEVCDDGNTAANDGCDATCAAVETGYACLQDTTPMDNICDTGGAGSVVPVCGDAIIVGSEVCDDGNTATGDGCDAACALEPGYQCTVDAGPDGICDTTGPGSVILTCSNSVIDGAEVCDDGNITLGDGCDANCGLETGYGCTVDAGPDGICDTTGAGSVTPICGDGIVIGGEICDDGNTIAGDGCDATCATVETGYACDVDATSDGTCDTGGAGSVVPVCGDGMVLGGEVCDDGNTAANDGCDATCAAVETGYVCLQDTTPMDNICDTGGTGSVVPVCGDSIIVGPEVCDDGNATAGDGCDASCALETGYGCLEDTNPADGICDTTGAGSVVPDTDGDGILDPVDVDDDNDGILDTDEGTGDTDGDLIPDAVDLDSDNDGIMDVVEGNSGCADTTPADAICDGPFDATGYATDGSGQMPPDSDIDMVPDFQDLDSDNDGLLDITEGNSGCDDAAATDGVCDTGDADGDGIADSIDDTSGRGDDTLTEVPNTDGDTQADYIDIDSDEDGITDLVEGNSGCTDTTPEDGECDDPDTDGDGITEEIDDLAGYGDSAPADPPNTDGIGPVDFQDLDSDDDGILDEFEGTVDTDGDTIPDYLDLDSDNDGIPDLVEGNTGCADILIRLGVCDGPDGDGDGVVDDATGLAPPDTDGDAVADFRDLDTDSDGIPDVIEGGSNCADTTAEDAVCDGPDADMDGIVDSLDIGTGVHGGLPDPMVDSDNDTVPDFRDLDSDDDGLVDLIEGGTACADANENGVCDGPDTDGDGIADDIDDTDGFGDGVVDTLPDADSLGEPDYLDLDSNEDGTFDTADSGCTDTTPADGVCDAADSDGDGAVDDIDAFVGFGVGIDTDNDGIANAQDLDDDNDGILDTDEGTGDTDGDGVMDSLDLDSDNDGISDLDEGGATCTDASPKDEVCDGPVDADGVPTGATSSPTDTDGDGSPDFQVLDSDGDTIPDIVEGDSTCTDADGDNRCDGVDTDGDGVVDDLDGSTGFGDPGTADAPDTDNDGTQDYKDLDSDGDTITDADEGTTDTDGDGIPDYRDLDVELGGGGCQSSDLPLGGSLLLALTLIAIRRRERQHAI